MLTKGHIFSWIWGGLFFTGLTLTIYLSSTTIAATSSSEASGTKDSLKLSIHMSKPAYLTGEIVLVHAALTNTGNTPISVLKPGPPASLFYWLDGTEVVRKLYSTISTAGPRPSSIVRLAPNNSLRDTLDLTMKDITYSINEGRHTLVGHYDTTKIPLEGMWKGEIKTSPLTFTVSSPTGAEANAYQLYQKLLNLQRSGSYHENFDQTKVVAAELISRFPQSVYVPCALWKVIPQLGVGKRYNDIVALSEAYFALRRSDDTYLVKGIARPCAGSYYHLDNPRKGLDILSKYAPDDNSFVRTQIEAALKSK